MADLAAGAALSLVALGLSHHAAPVAVRERLAFDEDGVRAELSGLLGQGLAREALLLSTCNRVELYAVPQPGEEDHLRAHLGGLRVGGEPLSRYLYAHRGAAAVRHLFRVASSLDSLVVGEPQILGQVKEAVRVAASVGSLGAVLHRLTQRSLWVAKLVRTQTDIGRHTVGVGGAGVRLAHQLFASLDGRRALLVGAGEMGQEVAKAMVGSGLAELLVANRTLQRAVDLAQAFGGTPLPFDRIDDYLHRVDVVIVASGGGRFVVDRRQVAAALRLRRYRPLFLVDLSVPRAIDPEVDTLDEAFLFNVDHLVQVVEEGRQARVEASREAEAMVEVEAERFAQRLADLGANDALGALVRKVDALREVELARTTDVLDRLDPADRARVEAMMRAFQKRVLHGPLASLRAAARAGDADALARLLEAWELDR
ncbi:MAG: glutamyl-tRNA reductase [Alphaproteobacteria bacterium]|nr:glutamyl-tRNA reductase [Alphaproteobacteria bacterium]